MTTPCPIIFTFSYTLFIAAYPKFSDPVCFPEPVLQMYWDTATDYISDVNYGWLNGNSRLLALNLMTAHIAYLFTVVDDNQVPYLMQTATIDKVTIGLTPPPLKNQFQWWLSTSAYGQMLLSLLSIHSIGGFFIGGLPERSAFRCVAGIFPGTNPVTPFP